ncbi:TPA: hypothetical protein ACH3X1_015114 [Trebouxia sp. C0004]
MTTLEQARQDGNAHRAQASTYTFTNEDLAKAAAYSTAADRIYGPMSVTLNADTFASVLDMAQRLHLNCLTQKCEDMLAQEDFQLTTGRSTTDSHSVVKWAHIAQKHHLLALQLRCERFMCENFHKILDDPLLQGLTRHSLLRMLRAQSAMVSVYKEHVVCPQTWGLASVGRHGAKPCCTHFSSAVTGSSDNYSALDTDMASVNDSTATSEHGGRSDQDSDAEPDEISDSADSCEVTSRRRQPPPARDRASHDIVRSWSLPGLPDVLPSASQRLPSQQ